MPYSIHNEWNDGTFEWDHGGITYKTKREACQIAKRIAASIKPWSDVARILVCDENRTTVDYFERPADSKYVHDIPHTDEQRIAAGYPPLKR